MATSDLISLKVSEVYKNFGREPRTVEVLRGVSLEMSEGQSLAITGPSGSGKSTLLHLIGTLDRPSLGTIEMNDKTPFGMPEPQLAKFRNQMIGFIFQDHHLLPQYSVLENLLMPTMAFKRRNDDAEERAKDLLESVGLAHRLSHRPAELSGGECQRVAVARALINRPRLLLCDEPTGNLDHSTADTVASLLFELHQAEQNILIVVTHSLELAGRLGRHLQLVNGRIAYEQTKFDSD